MSDFDSDFQAAPQPPAPPAVQQVEPKEGGSYTRYPATGELVKNEPAPADQPVQE